MFITDSRTEKDGGLRFYQQDIIMSQHSLSGDSLIRLVADQYTPGIGIALQDVFDTNLVYLCRAGLTDFSIIRRRQALSETVASFAISTEIPQEGKIFQFVKSGDAVELYIDGSNAGRTILPDRLDRYYFGIYSNRDNRFLEVDVQSGTPAMWNTNASNIDGGMISFYRNGFQIEGCTRSAQIEQSAVKLDPGIYYLDYEKEGDIRSYVFSHDDPRMDDEAKNILQENGRLDIDKPMQVNVKFAGTQGSVEEVGLKKAPEDAFIPTQASPLELSGSRVIIDLNKVKKIDWVGKIKDEPQPGEEHGLIAARNRVELDDTPLEIGKYYSYTLYNVEDQPFMVARDQEADGDSIFVFADRQAVKQLTVVGTEGPEEGELYLTEDTSEHQEVLTEPYEDKDTETVYLFKDGEGTRRVSTGHIYPVVLGEDKKIWVFYNINAEIAEMAVTYKDGRVFNVLAQRSSRHYVPDTSEGPIIVVDEHYNPLELSSSFRFYEKISPLTGLKDNFYVFTNWEREIFEPAQRLHPEREPLEGAGTVRVYGIPHGTEIYPEKIFKISDPELDTIEHYADDYTLLSSEDYQYNSSYGYIEILGGVQVNYKEFVVDYLKDNSYCINHDKELGVYEVSISTSSGASDVLYDQRATELGFTDIKPDDSKYVVLSKNPGAPRMGGEQT